jgi:phosphoribosylformylglycinamidine synthase II
VVMAGGRVGKDGIHGATFSSQAIEGEAPVGVVQIGDPMTQKRLLDMLKEARQRGLFRAVTDNGAGGLCSSVGELAEMSGGAHLELDQVPLKYPGLAAWEVLVSESQERMTLAVPPERWEELQRLAQQREVEVSRVGSFNDSGHFSASFQGQQVMSLELEFLHKGYPKRVHAAQFQPVTAVAEPRLEGHNWTDLLLKLLASSNISSREALIRQYDHEVQGSSVIKPLVGLACDGPSDAAVLQPDSSSCQGVVVSCAINPHYGDIDPERMAELLVDEALRNAVAVGADPDHLALLDNFCWPDPVGDTHKMAQLVLCCRGLARAVEAFQAPLISGKDSMKNDNHGPQGKLSIPPTLLVSAIANIPDVGRSQSMDLKASGDLVYLVGPQQSALGGSQLLQLLGQNGGQLGQVNFEQALRSYRVLHQLISRGVLASCHDCSEGGLLVALAEKCMAGRLGLRLELPPSQLDLLDQLFGEAPSRLLVSLAPDQQKTFEEAMADLPYLKLGQVDELPRLAFQGQEVALEDMLRAWKEGGPRL